MINRGN